MTDEEVIITLQNLPKKYWTLDKDGNYFHTASHTILQKKLSYTAGMEYIISHSDLGVIQTLHGYAPRKFCKQLDKLLIQFAKADKNRRMLDWATKSASIS